MRTSKARTGRRAGQARHRRWNAYGGLCRHTPKVGAVCVKAARTDLRGGRAMKRVSQVRDLDVPPQLRSRPAKFISFNSSAVD
jgi:hypothetical protein